MAAGHLSEDGGVALTVRIVVYGKPAPAGSKVAGRTLDGRSYVRDASKGSAEWKRLISQVAGTAMDGKSLLEGELTARIIFHLPRPKGHYGKKGLRDSAPDWPTVKPDVLKLARAVEDALSGIVYRDDAQIVMETIIKRYGDPTRCDISIGRIGEMPNYL